MLAALTSLATRKAAAAATGIGIDTFDKHPASLRKKLGASSSAQLQWLAPEIGLVAGPTVLARTSSPADSPILRASVASSLLE